MTYKFVFFILFIFHFCPSQCHTSPEKNNIPLLEFAKRMPKVDLHVHLEGTISSKIIIELAKRNKIKLPTEDEERLKHFFCFGNFFDFVKLFKLISSCLKKPEDYELISYEFGRMCKQNNVQYCEVIFTMSTNTKNTGLSWKVLLNSLNKGRERAKKDFGVCWNWILDIIRDEPESQKFVLDIVEKSRKKDCVVAINLTGDEKISSKKFKKTFNEAFKKKIFITPHAGETTGPKTVWDALNLLHANRIGHGVKSIDDKKLIEELRVRQIPLEICITSNICLKGYPNYKSHPIRKLFDAGLLITINTDDPAMFNTNLSHEYEHLVNDFNFTADELEKISLNGIKAAFISKNEKECLTKKFKEEFNNLRKELEI